MKNEFYFFIFLVVIKKWTAESKNKKFLTNFTKVMLKKYLIYEQNQRKQQKLKPLLRQVNVLHRMMKKLIKISAFIDTYKYFQQINEPLTSYNETFFYEIANNYYENSLREIVLKMKRLNHSRYYGVDFTIN